MSNRTNERIKIFCDTLPLNSYNILHEAWPRLQILAKMPEQAWSDFFSHNTNDLDLPARMPGDVAAKDLTDLYFHAALRLD